MSSPADKLAAAAKEVVESTHEERQDIWFLGSLERLSKVLAEYDASKAKECEKLKHYIENDKPDLFCEWLKDHGEQ